MSNVIYLEEFRSRRAAERATWLLGYNVTIEVDSDTFTFSHPAKKFPQKAKVLQYVQRRRLSKTTHDV